MHRPLLAEPIQFVYKNVLKKIFFRRDPETVHDSMVRMGKFLGKYQVTRSLTRSIFSFHDPSLTQTIKNITFKNPVGLSAGFDKNAELTDILPAVGFGFLEVGSITGEPCAGNAKPRLWRLPESQSLMVYYGLKNDGCTEIQKRLQTKDFDIPIGISVAKTNCKETVETTAGVRDYIKAYQIMSPIGHYDTINISCPNAFGGQPFTDKERLDLLLTEINKVRNNKPIFLKISPDLTREQIDELLLVSKKHNIDGFICSNLTKSRKNDRIKDLSVPEQGGMSGKIVEDLANNLIEYVYTQTKGKVVIIGVGGIFSAEDAYKKIRLGASLVQLITGMIFEGPQLIGQINSGLAELLKRDGFTNIAEARGVDVTLS